MKRCLFVATIVAAALASAGTLQAQTQSAPTDPNFHSMPAGRFSWRLGARFELQWMQIPGYQFLGARIVSPPVTGSPLHQLGLRVGDVVTRLDGTPIQTYEELDRHNVQTFVRYIRAGSIVPQDGVIMIPQHFHFSEAPSIVYYPPSAVFPSP